MDTKGLSKSSITFTSGSYVEASYIRFHSAAERDCRLRSVVDGRLGAVAWAGICRSDCCLRVSAAPPPED